MTELCEQLLINQRMGTQRKTTGKTRSRNYPEGVLESVKNHIKKSPVIEPNYVRGKKRTSI